MKQKKEIDFNLKEPYVFTKNKIPKHISYNPSYWLYNRQYFFKYSKFLQHDTGMIAGEVVVSKLCKSLGVDCVDCGFAINRQRNREYRGVLSKSFLKGKEKSITLGQIRDKEIMASYPENLMFQMMVIFVRVCPRVMLTKYKDLNVIVHSLLYKYNEKSKLLTPIDRWFIAKNKDILQEIEQQTKTEKSLSVDECERRVQLFAKEKGFTICDDIKLKLQKMAIVDAITKQYDRHAGNISIIYDEKKKTIKLAPMYDNSMCEHFAEEVSLLDYPKQVNCYLKLEESDFKEIADPSTDISKFYKKVCEFYKNGGAEQLFKSMQQEFCSRDLLKDENKELSAGLKEREKTDLYWAEAKLNYEKGIDYIDKHLKKDRNYQGFVEQIEKASTFNKK